MNQRALRERIGELGERFGIAKLMRGEDEDPCKHLHNFSSLDTSWL